MKAVLTFCETGKTKEVDTAFLSLKSWLEMHMFPQGMYAITHTGNKQYEVVFKETGEKIYILKGV